MMLKLNRVTVMCLGMNVRVRLMSLILMGAIFVHFARLKTR